jgi:nitrogen fixation protein FixH
MTPVTHRRRGWGWPLGLALALVASAALNISFAIVASRDASFAVEPDYYRKSLEWDRTMAQADANQALGWSLAVHAEPAADPGLLRLVVTLRDRAGGRIDADLVTVEARHGARAAQVVAGTLAPATGDRYAADLPLRRAGLWELRLTAHRGREVFTKQIAAELPGVP